MSKSDKRQSYRKEAQKISINKPQLPRIAAMFHQRRSGLLNEIILWARKRGIRLERHALNHRSTKNSLPKMMNLTARW